MNRRNFVAQLLQAGAGVTLAPLLPLAKLLSPVRAVGMSPALGVPFNTSGTDTGRFSSKHANISQIPRSGTFVVPMAGFYMISGHLTSSGFAQEVRRLEPGDAITLGDDGLVYRL